MNQEVMVSRLSKERAKYSCEKLIEAEISFRIEYNHENKSFYFHVDRLEALKAAEIIEKT